MPNLHFIVLPDGCRVNGDLRCISRELRLLQWRGMPFAHTPVELQFFNLTSIDFCWSTKLASLWTESNVNLEACPNLLRLNLMHCKSITKLPDSIGQSSRLQYLNFEGCSELKELPKSIGELKLLEYLDLNLCTRLEALPDTIGAMSNFQTLSAFNCISLLKLPSSIGLLSSLQMLEIQASTECESPLSDGVGKAWTRFNSLKLSNCGGVGSLLDYGAFESLESLNLSSRTLTELPDSIGLLIRLTRMSLRCERLQCLPKSIGNLKMLKVLWLSHCDNLKKLPKTLGALTSLTTLLIECCLIKRLPKSIGLLLRLLWLEMTGCKNLQKLPKCIALLSQLRSLEIRGSKNLQKLPTSIRQLKSLGHFELYDCGNIEAMGALTTLQGLPIWGSTSVTKLPASLGIVSNLVVYQNNPILYDTRNIYVGTSQVLEDQSGFLKVFQDESSGLRSLLRGLHKKQD